jgi:hypothetical protein
MLRRAEVEPKNKYTLMRYEGYRERSLRSLSEKGFAFIMKVLLHDARPEEGD